MKFKKILKNFEKNPVIIKKILRWGNPEPWTIKTVVSEIREFVAYEITTAKFQRSQQRKQKEFWMSLNSSKEDIVAELSKEFTDRYTEFQQLVEEINKPVFCKSQSILRREKTKSLELTHQKVVDAFLKLEDFRRKYDV